MCPFLYEISSIPSFVRPSNGSKSSIVSSHTRVMIAPTVRHAILINCTIADFDVWVAFHPRSEAFQDDLYCPKVEGTPLSVTFACIVFRGSFLTHPASVLLPFRGPDARDQDAAFFIELNIFDDRVFDTEQPSPCNRFTHAVFFL